MADRRRSGAVFAKVFYEHMLGGAPFGSSAAAARIACSEVSGGQTWAAYQCYGDPAFQLAMSPSKQTAATSAPISRDDLLRRIGSLGIRASDLRRVDGSRLWKRSPRSSPGSTRYAEWADAHGFDTDVETQRQLADVAKESLEFGRAATRYERLLAERQLLPPAARHERP